MAGGYRCSHGHSWNSARGEVVVACPVCGDTTLLTMSEEEAPAVFVLATSEAPANGQDLTQSIPPAELPILPPEHAPTLEFHPPNTPANGATATNPPDSFPSHAALISENGSRLLSPNGSSIVPFGPADGATEEFVPPPLVPGYEILHEVGRGGMGVVYKARQVNLNRLVALKMIISGSHAGPTERERFKREAEAVAALQNPHIVQIFEVGEANGHPYLALEFVEGGSLAHNLSGEPWDAPRAAELVEILARTMQFAHNAGIVHRDLKPGNILLTSAERGVRNAECKTEEAQSPVLRSALRVPHSAFLPKVTDFGLAKRLGETMGDGGTRTGAVLGTPSYIAPEQASGKTRDIGPSTDVYALGAILYELLTGRPPFRGETPLATVLQVLNDDPVPPKRLNPHVPRDLETICLKCLSKNPATRYVNASVFADDLRRFLSNEPILARPLSAWGRGVKWARRHPAQAVLLFMTIAATVSLVSVLSFMYIGLSVAAEKVREEAEQAKRARKQTEEEKKRAEDLAAENERRRIDAEREAEERKREVERTRRAAYALQLSQVAILCERDPQHAAKLLDDETRCPPDLRDFTWHYLRKLCQRDDRAYLDHQPGDPLRAVAYSPNAVFIATVGDAGSIRLWDSRTGRTWFILNGHEGPVYGLAFSPDGSVLASVGADRSVRLWVLPVHVVEHARRVMNLTTNWLPWVQQMIKPITISPTITLTDAHAGEVTCVAFSPDWRSLVTGGKDGVLRWWTLVAWHPSPPDATAFGGLGATALSLETAKQSPDASSIWVTREVNAHKDGVLCVSFSQNGKWLASGGNDSRARIWSGNGSKLERVLPAHADVVRAVAVSPDGSTVATANNGTPPTIRRFKEEQTGTWREMPRFFGHTKSIYALTFSDDGQLLASAGFDKAVRLWDAIDGRERGHLVGHTQQVNALAFAPDRRTIVSAGMDGAAVVWQTNPRTHEPEDLMRFMPRDPFGKNNPQGLSVAAFGCSGQSLMAVDDLGHARMFAADFVPPGTKPQPGPPGLLSLSPLHYSTPLKVPARAAATSRDGKVFVVATESGLHVWQPRNHIGRTGLPHGYTFVKTPAPVHSVNFDPSGRWLVTADNSAVRRYDMRDISITPYLDLKGGSVVYASAGVREVMFHPSGERLAVSVDNGVRIVTREGKVLAEVPNAHDPQANIDAICFDKSGTQLATGDASGLIKLWSLDASGKLTFVRALPRHIGPVFTLAFSPDGRTLASGGDDRTVILWDPVAGRERLSLTGHADRVVDLAFSADGGWLMTVSRDGAVKRWRADVRLAPDAGPPLPQPLPGM